MAQRNRPAGRRSSSGRGKRSSMRGLQLIFLIVGIIVVLSMVLGPLALTR